MTHKLCAALACCALAAPAMAGPDQISIMIGSEHVGATGSFEELNPGVFLTWREALWQDRLDVSLGAFRNSYGGGSVAVSTAYPLIRNDFWGLDVFGALALYPGDGEQFSHAWGDLVPIAGLQGRVGHVFWQAIPAGGQAVDATLTFGLTFDTTK